MMITQENIPYTADEIKAMVKTIEELRKKYNGALERASKLIVQNPFDTVGQMVEHIFPELAESEDEWIKDDIKDVIQAAIIPKESKREMLAWLEKQKSNTNKKETDDAYLQGICDAKHEIEKQSESTITNIEIPFGANDSELQEVSYYIPEGFYAEIKDDRVVIKKAEQKFKVGDWVVTDYGRVSRVVSVDKYGDGYTLDDGVYFSGSWCDMYHLWSINDAKDGDVLVDVYGNIGIYKSHDDFDWTSYCSLGCNEGFQNFKVEHENENTHPATKEQRDLLFEKMKEAGYEWDAEKKVLLKRDMGILPEDKMQAYIKYCNDKSPSNILCDKCNKAVTIEREYPYFYDKDENDVYFAGICPECGELFITKE